MGIDSLPFCAGLKIDWCAFPSEDIDIYDTYDTRNEMYAEAPVCVIIQYT